MKHQPHIASLLYTAPWCILPDVHRALSEMYRGYLAGNIPSPSAELAAPRAASHATAISCARRMETEAGKSMDVLIIDEMRMAIVPISGPIGKRLSSFEKSCFDCTDLADLEEVMQDLQAYDLEHVILDLKTPGGCAIGLPEAAAAIRELSASGTGVTAYVDYQCCSAGYWLAAAADEIIAAPSACIGSISTYIAGLDDSRRWEMQGLQLKLFRSGDLKAIGHPGKAWTEEEEKFLEDRVAQHGEEFYQWIESRRPSLSRDAMRGQWFDAANAPQGMVDGYAANLTDLMVRLAS